VFTYGMSPSADYVLRMLPPAEGVRSRFEVVADGLVLGPFSLNVPGRHNVLNATAAVAIGSQLEVGSEHIAQALRDFRGVDRRFQLKGCARGVNVVDDYGHHPTEIRASLNAARESGYHRVHVIFQPHRYTRTRDLMAEFATAFDEADTVQVLDIYAASEDPIAGVDSKALVKAIGRKEVQYASSFDEAVSRTVAQAADGDAILTLGAGSVSQAASMVLEALARA
jgi:UDP-N-acetylmuramate--alanine ligase